MRFTLGHLLATPTVLNYLELNGITPQTLIARHAAGEWGDIHPDDRLLNDQAIRNGSRLLSAYRISSQRIYIITEWDRSSTTILLASEY